MTDVEEIEESWRDKSKDDVLPLLGEAPDRIGAALSNRRKPEQGEPLVSS